MYPWRVGWFVYSLHTTSLLYAMCTYSVCTLYTPRMQWVYAHSLYILCTMHCVHLYASYTHGVCTLYPKGMHSVHLYARSTHCMDSVYTLCMHTVQHCLIVGYTHTPSTAPVPYHYHGLAIRTIEREIQVETDSTGTMPIAIFPSPIIKNNMVTMRERKLKQGIGRGKRRRQPDIIQRVTWQLYETHSSVWNPLHTICSQIAAHNVIWRSDS